MVTHVVLFTWTAEATREQIASLGRALDGLASDLAALVSIVHGADQRFRDGNADYGLVATFAGRADWDAYQAHPSHKAFVRDFVAPIQAARLTVQF